MIINFKFMFYVIDFSIKYLFISIGPQRQYIELNLVRITGSQCGQGCLQPVGLTIEKILTDLLRMLDDDLIIAGN